MKASSLKYGLITLASSVVLLILVLIPFHAFLTVWGAQLGGHYTLLRLWKEVLLLLLTIAVIYIVTTDSLVRSQLFRRKLVWLVLAFAFLTVAWGMISYVKNTVSLKAMAYGVLLDTRFLAFFLITWVLALRTSRLRSAWQPDVLWPALIVIVFGLLQYFVLPANFLSHFGYNASTIYPYETINHNDAYIRIQSFLRGANPLGAYLMVPLSLLTLKVYKKPRDYRWWLFLLAGLLALFLTFSRAAWFGGAIMIGLLLGIKVWRTAERTWFYAGIAFVVLAAGIVGLSVHSSTRLQNYVFHSQTHSAVATSSDQGHASALKQGIRDVVHQPFGQGPGSAGPASAYNKDPARIAENFYIQIGQESGWLGLILFLAINGAVGYLLWLRRHTTFGLTLFASFIAISCINMLSHAWTDDTIAYLWWGLAGIAMAPDMLQAKRSTKRSKQTNSA